MAAPAFAAEIALSAMAFGDLGTYGLLSCVEPDPVTAQVTKTLRFIVSGMFFLPNALEKKPPDLSMINCSPGCLLARFVHPSQENRSEIHRNLIAADKQQQRFDDSGRKNSQKQRDVSVSGNDRPGNPFLTSHLLTQY